VLVVILKEAMVHERDDNCDVRVDLVIIPRCAYRLLAFCSVFKMQEFLYGQSVFEQGVSKGPSRPLFMDA
jgi:hypothetical protein